MFLSDEPKEDTSPPLLCGKNWSDPAQKNTVKNTVLVLYE